MRTVSREDAAVLAATGWIFRCAGFILFVMVALATGVLGWILTHPTGGETVLAITGIPCLAGLLGISIDMMTDLGLSSRIAGAKPTVDRIHRHPAITEDRACTGS